MMKKLVLFCCALLWSGLSMAYTLEDFQLDESHIMSEMSELNLLDAYLDEHPGMSLEELSTTSFFQDLQLSPEAINSLEASMGGPIGVPSFIWGCCLGWVGILIVYLVEGDREETRKALIGCIVGTLLGCVITGTISVVTGATLTFAFGTW